MAITWEDFKQCVRIQGNLDLEVIDVAFIQPLKDLHAWWGRQSAVTKAYVNTFTISIGVGALGAFIAKVAKITVAELSLAFSEALGAVLVGLALGVALDIMGRCGLQAVESL
jgi:hypothetical protein